MPRRVRWWAPWPQSRLVSSRTPQGVAINVGGRGPTLSLASETEGKRRRTKRLTKQDKSKVTKWCAEGGGREGWWLVCSLWPGGYLQQEQRQATGDGLGEYLACR
jgi:hypothetical protein